MTMVDPISIAFILRFWLEQRQAESAPPIWRGVVEHVPSGERHYFENLEDLPSLVTPYLMIIGHFPQSED